MWRGGARPTGASTRAAEDQRKEEEEEEGDDEEDGDLSEGELGDDGQHLLATVMLRMRQARERGSEARERRGQEFDPRCQPQAATAALSRSWRAQSAAGAPWPTSSAPRPCS